MKLSYFVLGRNNKIPQTIGGIGIGAIAVMAFLVLISYPKIDIRLYPDESIPVHYATDFDLKINENSSNIHPEPTNVCFLIKNVAESIDSVPIKANNLRFSLDTNADCTDCQISNDLPELKAQSTANVCKKILAQDDLVNLDLDMKTSWNSLILPLTYTAEINCEKISEENFKIIFHCTRN